MSRKSKTKPTAAAVPTPAWLTPALVVVVFGLGAVSWLVGHPVRRVDLPSKIPAYPVSTSIKFEPKAVGSDTSDPRITNVQIVDFNRDGLNDLLVCDAARNSVIVYLQTKSGGWQEQILAEGLAVPAHATVVDLDGDGDLDVVVAVLGSIFPSDELVGKVIWLENIGGKFTPHILLDDVRRVADVQAADFNGDGRIDLAVAVFGYARGEVLWLENMGKSGGKLRFRDHQLLSRPGTIHVPVGDFDGDGKPDIAAVVTQDEEEVWIFQNLGKGEFKPHRIYHANNFDVGGAGLIAADLDQDGRLDLLVPQGDNLEDRYSWPQPYHGCLWLRNEGNWNFKPKQIANFGGTYAAAVADFNGDKKLDVVLVSYLGGRLQPSIVWLENDGHENFKVVKIADGPLGLVTVAAGDLNGDGRPDIVAGGLHIPPFNRQGYERVTIWQNRKAAP